MERQSLIGKGGTKDARLLKWQLIIVSCLYVGYAAILINRNNMDVALPAMVSRDLFDLRQQGQMLATANAFYCVGKFVNGGVVDYIGGKYGYIITLFATGTSSAMFGLGDAFAWSATLSYFTAWWSINKFFQSAGWMCLTQLTKRWFPPVHHGRVFGILSTSSRVGNFIATLGMGALLNAGAAWPWVFYIPASFACLMAGVSCFFLASSPSDKGLVLVDDALDVPGDADAKAFVPPVYPGHPAPEDPKWLVTWKIAKSPIFVLSVLFSMGTTLMFEFGVWIPTYLASLGLSEGNAGMAAAVFPLSQIFALLLFAYVYDKLSQRMVGVVMTMLVVLCTSALVALFMVERSPALQSLPLVLGLIFIFGFALSPPFYLPISIFSMSYGGKEHCGFMIGVIDGFAFMAALVFNLIAGDLAEEGRWDSVFTVLFGVSTATLLFSVMFFFLNVKRISWLDSHTAVKDISLAST